MSNQFPIEIDAATGKVLEHTPQNTSRYRCKLDTLNDVKREMAKVYREMRSGLIDNQNGTKQVWVLEKLGSVIATAELEQRLEALEHGQS